MSDVDDHGIRWNDQHARKAATDHYREWARRLEADAITAMAKADLDLEKRCREGAEIARAAALREANPARRERYVDVA